MRIDQVRAAAFGPLRGQSLDLAPGLTVVHGPNEAGKSSWFAATYAGLAGRRKQRGRGTQAQAQFAARHKPWSGSQWGAGVTVTLDDGRRLALEHNLAKGESRIVEVDSGRSMTVTELERLLGRPMTSDGGLDGARILGLNRDAARATIFVAQADVLRVLHDAGELQQLLERVATTETADVTAEAALQWLDGVRRERVGSAHLGSKPLRAATAAVEAARAAAVDARDQHAELVGVLAEQVRAAAQLAQSDAHLAELERLSAWARARELAGQLAQARELASAATEDGPAAADEELVRRVTVALAALDERGACPVLSEGPDAAALAEQLASLPPAPEGDLEPTAEARAAHDAWVQADAAVSTHEQAAPTEEMAPADGVDPDELRQLAGRLEVAPLEPDTAAEERVAEARRAHTEAMAAFEQAQATYRVRVEEQQRAQADYEARWAEYQRKQADYAEQRTAHDAAVNAAAADAQQRAAAADKARGTATALLGAGALAVLVGIVLLAVGQVLPGAAVAGLGTVFAVVGLVRRGSSSPVPSARPVGAPPEAPVPPEAVRSEPLDAPVRPEPDPVLLEEEARLAARRSAVEAAASDRAALEQRLRELELPADAGELRRRARAREDAAGAARRLREHRARAVELEGYREAAGRRLGDLVGLAEIDPGTEAGREALAQAWDEYVVACRTRAQQATEAARRPGLEQAVAQRRELEEAHALTVAEWKHREQVVADLAGEVREDAGTDPAASLRGWLEEQKSLRQSSAQRRERGAALVQLLGDRTLEELAAEAEAARPDGPEPDDVPTDLQERLHAAQERKERLLGLVGDLRGQQTRLVSDMPSVARALEDEAAAEQALETVTELAGALDVTIAELERAKERSHATVAPALEGCVRPWVPEVTRGRYLDARINPADLTMKVTDHAGAVREASLLSHGTTEQLYLLLRVALAQTLASVDETAPLVLDDVTVQSDVARTRAVLDLLHRVSAERQVVLFSQEDEVVAWAQERLGEQDALVPLPEPAS